MILAELNDFLLDSPKLIIHRGSVWVDLIGISDIGTTFDFVAYYWKSSANGNLKSMPPVTDITNSQ